MKFDWKKALSTVVITLFMVVIFGGITLFLFLLGNLGMFPLYVTKVIPVVGTAAVIALSLTLSGYLKPQTHRLVSYGFLALCLLSLGYIAHGAYKDSIPTVDDRQLLIHQYVPFEPDTKALYLGEDSTLHLTAGDILSLQLDGATALYPVYSAFVQATFPEGDYPLYTDNGYGRVACSGTIDAYQRLIHGEADMIFAAAPSQAQLDDAEAAGMELHLTPIGSEAFVFFVNSKNPVTGLSVEQIRGIYSGAITNWSQVGGKRQSIRPFQRAENSGSQSALQRLMGDLPLIEPEEADRIAGMGGIISEVASYRNYRNAVGFSFRYYATEMARNGDIRLLALNGVEPTKETIRDATYPISSHFYAITAAPIGDPSPEERNETMAAFLEWILSPQGQTLIEETGYVGLN